MTTTPTTLYRTLLHAAVGAKVLIVTKHKRVLVQVIRVRERGQKS